MEEIRRHLERKYGSSEVHEGGLRVYTSLNLDLQRAATIAVLDGLAAYEHRHGWQGHLKNIFQTGNTIDKFHPVDWDQPILPGSYVHALVTDMSPQTATVKFARYTASISSADIAWTGRRLPKNLLTAGDVAYVKVVQLNPDGSAKVLLEQDSGLQGALLAIDNSTGDIKAMVGGRDFNESKFNRAIQAQRQVGSTFKPFVYTAAVDDGADPDDVILDGPTTFNSVGAPYTPHNYDHKFEGNITLRHALATSRNIPAVKLAQRVGMTTVATYARKFGINSQIPPYLPVALGAADLTLYETTAAFSVFPNDGVRIEPRYIRKVTDYEGHVLEEDFSDAKDVTSPRTARVMVSLLKTGTTNEYTDAWFVGFSPSITCGVWIGFDEKKTLGKNETGGLTALPVWIDFMRAAISEPPRKDEAFAPVNDRNKAVAVKRPVRAPARASHAEAH